MLKNSLAHIFRSWQKHFVLQFSTVAVLFGTFFIICFFGVLGINLQKVLSLWGEQSQMTVYLKNDLTEQSKTKIQQFLKAQKGVKEVRLVTRTEALDEFKNQIGSYAPELLNDPEIASVIPESLVLSFEKAFVGKFENLQNFATKVKSQDIVEDVSYGQEWIQSFSSLIESLGLFSKIVVGVLLAASILVVGNSIRSSIQQRRHEIEVLELIGATANWIRIPFVMEGFLMGFFSSSLAIAVSYVAMGFFKEYGLKFTSLSQLATNIAFISVPSICLVIFMACILGAFGSYLCVRRINTGGVTR
ncbi:MAG: cell division protein FtsX [Pseudobdellovibrionaceae bacterium]